MRQGGQQPSAMGPAWDLWNAGDKVAAKRAAEQVLKSSPPDDVAAEARDLLSRLNAPFKAYAYGLFAAAVICAMILLATLRYGP